MCGFHGQHQRSNCRYLGIVMHFVLIFWVVMAFSSSSSCPVFFSFFTRLFTAFSHHFSSWPFCSPFFQPRSLLTMGGVKGRIDILSSVKSVQCRKVRWFWTKHENNCPCSDPNGRRKRYLVKEELLLFIKRHGGASQGQTVRF